MTWWADYASLDGLRIKFAHTFGEAVLPCRQYDPECIANLVIRQNRIGRALGGERIFVCGDAADVEQLSRESRIIFACQTHDLFGILMPIGAARSGQMIKTALNRYPNFFAASCLATMLSPAQGLLPM